MPDAHKRRMRRGAGAFARRVTVAIALTAAVPAAADSPARPRDYAVETAGGGHVFVMKRPLRMQRRVRECREALGHHPRFWERDDYQGCLLASRKPRGNDVAQPWSGLYEKGGAATPEWRVQWYAFNVHLSRDGRFLVRYGPWASFMGQLAVAFYDRGRLLAAYPISALVTDEKSVFRTVSHFMWRRDVEFDVETNRLMLSTRGGDVHHFDATTGALVASTRYAAARYSATVTTTAGATTEVRNVEPCGGALELWEPSPRPMLRGYTHREPAGDGAERLTIGAIPFAAVDRIESVEAISRSRARWRVHGVDGQTAVLEVDAETFMLCARSGGDTLAFAPGDVASVVLRAETAERFESGDSTGHAFVAAQRHLVAGNGRLVAAEALHRTVATGDLTSMPRAIGRVVAENPDHPEVAAALDTLAARLAREMQPAGEPGNPQKLEQVLRHALSAYDEPAFDRLLPAIIDRGLAAGHRLLDAGELRRVSRILETIERAVPRHAGAARLRHALTQAGG